MTTPTKALTVSDYMRQSEQLARFSDLLGKDAQAYVQSVLIAVGSDEKLRECTPQSIYKSALRAASLGLSCDPATKQAWLIPYNKKIKTKNGDTWVKEAQFQPHYLGLYNLAMRTGKYWTINVSPVYEGQRVLENPMTGLHVVVESNGFIGEPKSYNAAYVDVTTRRTKDMKVIGWIGYFKTKRGAEKSIWMGVDEIEDHARKYVKEYEKNQNWSDVDKRRTMEMKTVLRKLLAWADLSGSENTKLVEALQADTDPVETIDAPAEDIQPGPEAEEEPRRTVEQNLHDLGITQDAYRYNDERITSRVEKITGYSKDDATRTMFEAFKKKRVPEMLTVAEAEQFARSLINPPETAAG